MNQRFGTVKDWKLALLMSVTWLAILYCTLLWRRYDEKCDIWSCGVILYILLCGYPPFNGSTDKIIMDKVAAGRYDFNGDEWVWISEDAKKIIKKLLEYDPDSRISAEKALADPWIKNLLLRKKSTSLWLELSSET